MSDSTPELDIRWPIGLLFALLGALLAAYGAVNPADTQRVGLNLNLIWGAAMFLFGGLLLWSAYRAGRANR